MAPGWSSAVLQLLNKMNNFIRPGSSKLSCKPFIVDGTQVGYISQHVSTFLSSYGNVFFTVKKDNGEILHMTLNPEIKTFAERTEIIAEVMVDLRQKDVFGTLRGWRDEASMLTYSGELDLEVRGGLKFKHLHL